MVAATTTTTAAVVEVMDVAVMSLKERAATVLISCLAKWNQNTFESALIIILADIEIILDFTRRCLLNIAWCFCFPFSGQRRLFSVLWSEARLWKFRVATRHQIKCGISSRFTWRGVLTDGWADSHVTTKRSWRDGPPKFHPFAAPLMHLRCRGAPLKSFSHSSSENTDY